MFAAVMGKGETDISRSFRRRLELLAAIDRMPLGRSIVRTLFGNRVSTARRTELFGLDFKNPVGLAANVDCDGVYCNCLSDLGFSFIEVGPLSYLKQGCNTDAKHIAGVKKAVGHLIDGKPGCIISGNIGRNPQSRGADALKDYENAFALLYDFVDMTVIYPTGTDSETDAANLPDIIDRILTMRMYYDRNKPVLVRLTPELSRSQTDELIACCLSSGIDGVVAGETRGTGDESGLLARNLNFIRYISDQSRGLLPIIGVGGVMTSENAAAMMEAGASLVEIYTGISRKGFSVAKNVVNGLTELDSEVSGQVPNPVEETAKASDKRF